MDEPGLSASVLDTFLRLSLTEGFTVDHLRRLRSGGAPSPLPFAGVPPGSERSLLDKGRMSLDSPAAGDRVEAVREACARASIAIVAFGEREYPEPLLEIRGAPLVLYRAGPPWTGGVAVAVVGSRTPTAVGREFARVLAEELSAAGCVVVSGMARGVDAAAHRGALRGGGGTVAVLGCGVDVTYPPEHAGLRAEILEGGAIYSEYPPGSLPLPRRFPARNRIVSGLCAGVVVAEAPERSGALITARIALEQGREVMAVPGNPWFAHTAGSNRLLREGAAPVCSAVDVLDALGAPSPARDAGLKGRIIEFLSRKRHAGEISAALSSPLSELLPALMELEVANLVEKRPGDYYKRKS